MPPLPLPAARHTYSRAMTAPQRLDGRVLAVLALLCTALFTMLPVRADAYPENPVCTCTVSSQNVKSGQKINFHGESKEPLNWTVTFNGKTKHHKGLAFDTSFVAPKVATTKHFTLQVESSFANTRSSARSTTQSGACRMSFDITVSPRSGQGGQQGQGQGSDNSDGNGLLPNTGGPQLALLGGALLLLLLGALSIRRARRD